MTQHEEGLGLPPEVEAVLGGYLCCELATLAADGTPVAWPAAPLYLPDRGRLLLTTTIGFPVKASNIGRDPRVSLLFSDPTGSGLRHGPAVLVQGTATVSEEVQTWGEDLGAHWRRIARIQPASRFFSRTPPVRWFMDWYYMRLVIHVTPARVVWWAGGDTSSAPRHQDVSRVG